MIFTFTDIYEDRVVSSVILYVVKLPSRYLGVIEEVWTDEHFRHQGRATKLLKQALGKARELELDCVELTVRQDQPHIQEFYKSLGFYDRQNISMRCPIKRFHHQQ